MRHRAGMRAWLPLFLLSACGTSPDERPVAVEVVALSVLAPSCGQAQCHSSTTKTKGYAFDTFDGAKAALRQLIGPTAERSKIIEVMRASGGERMPPDAPLAEEDIQLVEAWINAGGQGL
jgi:hypothetical protein